ncbi:hypothetical protein OG772_36065 [Streptomyces sp. NBC_01321]|uniref:hypothetical protein n=1 Tax=Streptomyces sp. NBC_01321 TaxID=2903825 RepID=UPI002E0E79F8|nr:hypothetical protein OG772_36065 [Streptomyces sp. NBC_01321]
MPTYDFPQDLGDAQLALHQTRTAYEQYATTLPWSAVPMPGWEGEKQLHSGYQSRKDDSPGYTEEQALRSPVSRSGFWSSASPCPRTLSGIPWTAAAVLPPVWR